MASIGGNILTSDLANILGLDILSAESSKRQENYFDSYSPAQKAVESYADQIIYEANRVFDYFTNRNNHEIIEKVFLCGGGALMPGLSRIYTKKIWT